MARIYKESRYVLQLLIGKSYGAQYDDVKISFYTKNPNNQVMVDNDITIKRNIAEVKIESTLFDDLEDGLIKYIVYGTKDGIPFIEERISNYFLKTPLDFKPSDRPIPPQDGWGMTGYFNNWGGTPDIPFEEDGEWDGRPYKVIRNFEAVQGEFKIRRNNAWTDSRTASFENIPQFAKLVKGDSNMSINDGVWDIYLFFGNDGVPNEMLVLNPGTDLSTIQYEYTLNLSADKESAIFLIGDSFDYSAKNYYGGSATIPMKYGCRYSINVFMEGYEDIFEEITCYNDEERSYTLTKIEGYGCNFINPIVFSEDAGNTINAENVQIPAFVYEGNQHYNVDSFNLADIEEFKIHILFKPNNSGDAEPINVFGCEDTDWDNTTFGARIHQGWIYFRMSGEDVSHSYTENTWYDVEMGYNTTKKWVIVNGETLLDEEYASFNKPSQTLMIGAINSGGNAFRPFYGKIAAIYVKSNANQIYLLPKEDGTMGVYWNNLTNSRNSISGDNNARFENDYISGDGMKSITWLGNLEDKWVTPSMSERDGNGYIVVYPSEGYNGLKRTVINPQTLYNEGYGQGKTDGANEQKSKLVSISITENGVYSKEDGYNHIEVNIPTDNVPEYPYSHIPTNTIYYKTADGQLSENIGLDLNGRPSGFGLGINGEVLNIVSNTYEDGVGKIVFDGEVYRVGPVMYSNITETGDKVIKLENIVEIQLPSSITRVENGAFSQTGLREIILPPNITQIDTYALKDMQYLYRIVFYSDEPEILQNNEITLNQTTFGKILHNKAYDYSNMKSNTYYKQKGWTFETF